MDWRWADYCRRHPRRRWHGGGDGTRWHHALGIERHDERRPHGWIGHGRNDGDQGAWQHEWRYDGRWPANTSVVASDKCDPRDHSELRVCSLQHSGERWDHGDVDESG